MHSILLILPCDAIFNPILLATHGNDCIAVQYCNAAIVAELSRWRWNMLATLSSVKASTSHPKSIIPICSTLPVSITLRAT